jgi:cysteinyl-tRNA synthetase
VRYWLHNGFVNVDSEKMSKSLGNFFTIRDVLQSYHSAALRWFLVSSQYRTPLNYTQRGLEEASDRVYYVYQTLADVAAVLSDAGEAGAAAMQAAATAVTPAAAAAAAAGAAATGRAAPPAKKGVGSEAVGLELVAAVLGGLCDDLNTPQSVSALSAPLKAINDLLTTKAGRKNPQR